MRISPQMQGLGCVTSLISLGALISGVYQGLSEAKGAPIDPTLKSFIRYGPVVLNGLLGFSAASMISNDPSTIDDLLSNAPPGMERQQAEGCMKGCVSTGYPIISASITAGLEYIGYVIAKSVGSNV